MCVALMKELEEALTVEELMDKVVEMVQEKVHYDAKIARQNTMGVRSCHQRRSWET